MTAKKTTRRDGVNPTGGAHQTDTTDRVSGSDESTIIDYLETETPRSIDQIAGKCRLPRAYLRALLRDLAAAGRIEYTDNFANVWLPDGGRNE